MGTLAKVVNWLHWGTTTPVPADATNPLPVTDAQLATLLAELQAINTNTDGLEVNTDGVEGLLTTLNSIVATQATLAALNSAFTSEDFASQATLAALKTAFDNEDFASQTTLAAALTQLQNIGANTDGLENAAAVLSKYNIADGADKTTTAGMAYYGFEEPGGKWYIMREDKTGVSPVYLYTNGASDYATGWANLATHTYARLSTLTGL